MIKRFALLTVVAAVAILTLSACGEAGTIKAQAEADAIRQKAQAEADAANQATAAKAANDRIEIETAQAAKAGAIAGRTVAYAGLGLAAAILSVGLALAAVTWVNKRAGLVYPTVGGQFPLVKVWGPGWSGVIDPNRSPGVAIVKAPTKADHLVAQVGRLRGRPAELADPQVEQPKALSEAGILQLTAQAAAVAMMAGATRHPGSVRSANVRDAVEGAITRATVITPVLPTVEDIEPSHIDRLLLLPSTAEA